MNAIINIQDLKIRYKEHAIPVIEHLNLSLEEGRLYALLGSNGCGKSTLLRVIAGLQAYQGGSIVLRDKELKSYKPKDLAKYLSVVLTDQGFQGLISVKDFIAFGRYPFTSWLGNLSTADKQIVEEAILRFELTELQDKLLGQISDGQLQRVQLARAYAQESSILLLDEPSTHLDIKSTRAIFKLMQMLSREEGKTVIFSSHQLDLSVEHADYLIVHGPKGFQILSPSAFKADQSLQMFLIGA